MTPMQALCFKQHLTDDDATLIVNPWVYFSSSQERINLTGMECMYHGESRRLSPRDMKLALKEHKLVSTDNLNWKV